MTISPSKNPKTNQKCSANGTSAKSNAWTWLWLITSNSIKPTPNTWPTTLPGSTRPGSRKPSAIVERLVNALMQKGRNNGKKMLSMRIVKHAFEIIHVMTGENPVQICVSAIMNGGPREDSTRIGRAGSVRRQACDVSPMRRVNQAIWLITTGAKNAAFRNIKTIVECLADELMNAAKGSSNSFAIKKKDELERVAKSNR